MPTQFSLKRLIICTFQKIKPTLCLHYAYTKNIQPTQNLHRLLAKTRSKNRKIFYSDYLQNSLENLTIP